MKRAWMVLLVLLLCLVPVCTLAGAAPARSGGTLRFAFHAGDLGNLDPHYATGSQDRAAVDMVFNALVRQKPGDASVFEPDLATTLPKPRLEKGKQVWIFPLRKGVMFHAVDGLPSSELTSEDVVYSLQKAADPKRSAYSGEYTGMTFEALDASTVKITVDPPLSPLLFFPKVVNYAGGFIVSKRAVEKLGPDGMKTRPVGTGPFMFTSYMPMQKISLTANPSYFRGRAQLDGVDFFYMPDVSTREAGLRSGQLDAASGEWDKAWVDRMAGDPKFKLDLFGVGETQVVHLNQSIPPLERVQVRQAIAYALDRNEFQGLFGTLLSEKLYSVVPVQFIPGGLTYEEVAAKHLEYKTDREKAKQLLAAAGYPNGFTLKLITSEMVAYKSQYESMQAQLAKVGIKIELQVVDHSSYHSLIRKNANALVVYGAYRPNADAYLTRFYHSESIVAIGAKPDTNFSHGRIADDLIVKARQELDEAKQRALWKEAQVRILENMLTYTNVVTRMVFARSPAVDYGHELKSVRATYPGIDENTRLVK
jgi:peptide/nickel transport system substrate-binding protein